MNSNTKIRVILTIFTMIILLFSIQEVTANNIDADAKEVEYTEEYKKWLNLPEEEKAKTLQPRMYKISSDTNYLKSTNNIFKLGKLLRATPQTRYSLNDDNVIKDNVKIKNQGRTNSCWAFAYMGSLETNLAMQDKQNSNPLKIYDFSERHMIYASSRNAFLDNQINENGHSLKPSQGGSYTMAEAYLSNGSGAISEEEMPFVDNENDIDIESIKNKEIITTLYDTVLFNEPSTDEEKEELKLNMKSHISNYGGIYAGIHGAKLVSDYYNNNTGAIYCNDKTNTIMDHAVLIIGWDDNYDKNNFNEKNRPQNNGAWIIKNSWGEKLEISLEEFKNIIVEQSNGKYTSIEEVTDEIVQQVAQASGCTVENDVVSKKIGDNGYMYISYEDVYVYSELVGVQKAKNEKDYSKIYQNDVLGVSKVIRIKDDTAESKVYLANVFNRENITESEAIDKISINTAQEYKNCKVYINPNGSEKTKESLKEVSLKSGDTINLKPGYHMIEFSNPQQITGKSFVVVLEFDKNNGTQVSVESVREDGWEDAIVNSNESFYTTDIGLNNGEWVDLAQITTEAARGNNTIKAFATNEEIKQESELSEIMISKQPTKVQYKEGEDFDTTGMEITAVYSNGEKKVISEYKVEDGEDLKEGKTTVTISYAENGITKTISQQITVTTNGNTPGGTTPDDNTTTGGNTTPDDNTTTAGNTTPDDNTTTGGNTTPDDNTTTGGNTTPDNEKEPKASNFDSAKGVATNAVIYTYKELNKEPYCEMTIKISNIKIGDKDNKYTYYYCIATSKDASGIKDEYWISVPASKVKEESDGTYSITLDVSSKEQKNLEELSEADQGYLVVKEVAEINGKKIETINDVEVVLEEEPVVYLDDKKVGDVNQYIEGIIKNPNYIQDSTIANRILPNTGNLPLIIGAILLVLLVGGFAYFRYRNIDK